MNKHTLSLLLISSILIQTASGQDLPGVSSFNADWKFYQGKAPGAESIDFNDSEWRKIDLPHDWAIEGPFDIKYNARCGGLPFHGTGWYRKHFTLPERAKGKHITLHFDGAMSNAMVWLNNELVGERPNGYIGFSVDLSEHIRLDTINIIAVRLSPEDFSSRWYPGAGIYRNTYLEINHPVHVAKWGTYITTPEVSMEKARINIVTEIENVGDTPMEIQVETRLYFQNGAEVASVTSPHLSLSEMTSHLEQLTEISNPEFWQLEQPNLYKAVTRILNGTEVLDVYETTFGIRTIDYDVQKGFSLNDQRKWFKGACLHHDLGPLGTAVNRRATQRQLEIMQQMGVNAIRTSHNPPSPEQVELCEKMGIMMQVEAFDCWSTGKVENGYNKYFDKWHEQDLRDMLRAFRNSPAIVMWSIGNEVKEQRDSIHGGRIARRLAEICREEDPTRPVTMGFNSHRQAIKNGLADAIDLVGWNYGPRFYGKSTAEHPDWMVYGSETSSTVSSRGTYHIPLKKYDKHESLQISSYDIIGPGWTYPPELEFEAVDNHSNLFGEFIWTGIDYLGEPTPYGGQDHSTDGYWNSDWPSRSSYFGAVDLCGIPKDRFYLYQSQWTEEPMVHVLPHWNWEGREGDTIPVFAYTNGEEVELFLNGRSMGRKIKGTDLTRLPANSRKLSSGYYDSPYRLSWQVPYQSGEIKAVAYKDGKEIAKKSMKTAGKPSRIELVPDRKRIQADGADMSFITVRVLDKDGILCPEANNLIQFRVEGEGAIAAVGNGNPATTDSFQNHFRNAFNGMCMLYIKATESPGEIRVSAEAQGLEPVAVELHTSQ